MSDLLYALLIYPSLKTIWLVEFSLPTLDKSMVTTLEHETHPHT